MRQARRPLQARQGREGGGLLPPLRHRLLVHAEAQAGGAGRLPVRGRGLHRPRRPRLDLPRQGPQRLQPLGGAEGPARRRRRRCDGGSHRRAAVPRRGGAPEHRQDLQLRGARGPRLHRHGVRRRPVAEGGPQAVHRRDRRASSRRPGHRLHARDPPRPRLPAQQGPALLRLQAGERYQDRGTDEGHRPRWRAAHRRQFERPLRHRRLPGARGARAGGVDRL